MKRLHLCALTLTTWAAISAVPARAEPPPRPDLKRVESLVRQLDHADFAHRQQADGQLRSLGLGVVPLLQSELQNRPPLEVVARLETLIADLTRLSWHEDVAAAKKEAERTGKPLLVLSTLGKEGGLGCLVARAMQATTFADLEVIALLQRDFVLVWHDQLWDDWYDTTFQFERALPSYSEKQLRNYREGGGRDNLRLFFCAADGSVVTSLRGFYNAQRFLNEARFASKLLAAQEQGNSAAWQSDLARLVLAQRVLEIARERQGLGTEENGPAELLEQSLSESAGLYGKAVHKVLADTQTDVERRFSFG